MTTRGENMIRNGQNRRIWGTMVAVVALLAWGGMTESAGATDISTIEISLQQSLQTLTGLSGWNVSSLSTSTGYTIYISTDIGSRYLSLQL